MQIAPKKHAGFNRDAPKAQKCRKKMKNDDFDDDDDEHHHHGQNYSSGGVLYSKPEADPPPR